jgi:predicted  nucleic acid-binding Zn-ribbon protein
MPGRNTWAERSVQAQSDLSGINESLKEKDEQIKDLKSQLANIEKMLGYSTLIPHVNTSGPTSRQR